MRSVRVLPLAIALALISACSDSTAPTKPAGLEIVGGNAQTGVAGEALPTPLSVKVVNNTGIPLRGVTVTWSVAAGGGIVAGQGVTTAAGIATALLVLGNTAGTNSIQAAVEGASAVTFTAVGIAGAPGLVKISRDSFVTRVIGDTTRLSATVTDVHGNAVTAGTVTWSSSNVNVADVNAAGLVTVKGRGTATITGRSQSAAGSMTVRVISVARVVAAPDSIRLASINQTGQITATAFDAQNVSMPGVVYAFTSLTPAVATVTSGGQVKAVGNGTAQIVVTGEGPADTVLVRVSQVLKTIAVNPALANVPIGSQVQLSGFGIDSLGTAIAGGVTFTWLSSDTAIAKISSTGLVTGIGRGTATITGTAGALTATATVNVTVLLSGVTAGAFHTCALGNVSATLQSQGFCWGQQTVEGRLGNGTTSSINVATPVSGNIVFTQISAGDFHTCALDANGTSYCWGANTYGELGNLGTGISLTPVGTVGVPMRAISAGNLHTCAIGIGDSLVYCWGNNTFGQLGLGAVSPQTCNGNPCATGPNVVSSTKLFTKVSAGLNHTCAIETPSGAVWCWGANNYGQLGTNDNTASNIPVLVQTAATFTDISAGDEFTCGVTTDSRVMCWGRNDANQLGNIVTTPSLVPGQVGASATFVQVAAGGLHACARTSSGAIYCWGSNVYGQIGNSSTATATVPAPVSGILTFTSVAAGHDHTCASTSDALYCWGRNGDGQLGTADNLPRSSPTLVK